MATPPSSPPPPPLLTGVASHSSSTLKQTRKATRLRSLVTRPVGAKRPLVYVDPATGKADGPHRKRLRTYLAIATAFDLRTKKKILHTVGEWWRQFKSDLMSKWALAADKNSVDDTVCEKYDISKEKWAQFCQSRRDPSWEVIQKQNSAPHVLSCGVDGGEEKETLEETTKSGNTDTIIDPPSPIRRHMKWKMVCTKKTRQMTSEEAKEIADKIDVLTTAIGRLEHPSRMRAAGVSVTIKRYFGSAPRTSCTSSSMAPEDLEQLTQKIRDKLEDVSITNDVLQPDIVLMQSQGLAFPLEPEVDPSAAHINTKERNDPDTGDSEKYGLYIEENPPHLVALGRLYEGSTTVHNIPLSYDQVKVGVEEFRDADAHIPLPTKEVQLVGQALNTFIAWLTHLLFLKSLLVMLDATVFGVFNDNFPLYIKHEDLSEIAHGGQCLSISVIQLWILHMTKTNMRAGNADVYGFLKPQSIQRSGQSQFESEKLNAKFKEGCVHRSRLEWFTLANGRHFAKGKCCHLVLLDNYLKGIINSALKGLDNTPQSKSKAAARCIVVKRTRKASRLRSLSTRPPGAERPVVHVDPAIGKADGPHRKKLRTYLEIVARDKVDVTYENWKEVPTAQKDLIWEDIQASDSMTKWKLLQTVGERWRQFKLDLTRKWALAADQDGVEDIVCEKCDISKEKWAQFFQTRRDPSWEDVRKKAQAIQKQNSAPHVLSRGGYDYLEQKLLAEKTKKKLEEVAQSGSIGGIIDPPSPVRRHMKWKMARTKKTGEMTIEAAKEIAEKIDSFEEQATQGSFVPHGRQDVLAAAIGRPEHPGCVRAAGAGVTIKQYFGSAPRTSRSASSLPPDELQQLTQQIRDQLEESITEKVTRQVMASFSQLQSQMQSQGLAVPPEPLVGPSGPRVSTKGSFVDISGNDPETGNSDRCGLYIEADFALLVAMGRVYEGSTVVHNTHLLPGQVKVSVEEVRDADAPVLVPTDEVSLVGQALHTFFAWPTHMVVVSPAKPPLKPDPEVDDLLYLMTLTIAELFLRPYQVRWDATVFGVFNPDFPLYIKHEDLSEIAHGGQCLSISVLQLWILHLTETCMQVGNSDIYGFLEPQSIQSGHWQMVVILPKEHLVVWFCSLHNRPGNYLKGIINSAIKGLDDAPQPKSKAYARWIVAKYFNDPRPLEPERLKALRIQ
ncbi:hypothetical protein HKD37_02G004597 [Glycine soja]